MPTGPRSSPPMDLRARNLARNRAEVAEVALELFVERGFDHVTVEDIAEAAGISRRTFFRYFESKEDAVLPAEADRLEELRAALAERPPTEPVLVSIRHAIAALAAGEGFDSDISLARLRIAQAHPSVHARALELQTRSEDAVRHLVAERLGVDGDTSLTARVAASAAIATFRAAAEVWLATDGEQDLAEVVGEAFDLLAGGLPLDTA